MQDAAESLEDRQEAPGRDLVEELADLLGELDRDFDRVVRRVVEEHGEQLQRHELVGHLVVAEVREELGEAVVRRVAAARHDLVARRHRQTA